MKKICLLGSTGSIGESALDVIRKNKDKFRVTALTVNTNVTRLEEQIREFHPDIVVIRDEKAAKNFNAANIGNTEILTGNDGLTQVTKSADYDILLSALVGFAGLAPTLEAVKRKKRIALANKETLVAAGEIVMKTARDYGTEIIPVDSEHSAIFQCLTGETPESVRKIILTASGGPFRNSTYEQLQNVTVKEALNHPNWKMGNKITIDSATMMNKGLEVIEARWLFDTPLDKIDVVIHPQSIIHSMVEYRDGSIKAQLSMPDMKLPIIYAFSYPERIDADFVQTNFPTLGELSFYEPDVTRFPALKLAFEVLEQGGCAPCILNAANEVAVNMFLEEKIKFLQIPEIVENALQSIDNISSPDLETIFEIDRQTREYAENSY